MLAENISLLQNIEFYILLFFIYSFMGWFMESVGGIFVVKKFINRGFLIGPYCPVYGLGVCLITLQLSQYTDSIFSLFLLVMLTCGILEYSTGYVMEKMFKARWWDYSDRKFNINGRICLETLVPFSILGTFFLFYTNPFFVSLFLKVPEFVIHIIAGALTLTIIIDILFSLKVMNEFKNENYKKQDNTEEISKRNQELAEDALMKLESDIRHRTRKLKLKTLRKVKYRRIKIENELKELAEKVREESIKRKERNEKIKREIEEEFEKVKEKLAEVSIKAKERFKDRNVLNKRLLEAFPKAKIVKKVKKVKKINKK